MFPIKGPVRFYSLPQACKALATTTALSLAVVWLGHTFKQLNFVNMPGYKQAAAYTIVAKTLSLLFYPVLSRYYEMPILTDNLCNICGGMYTWWLFTYPVAGLKIIDTPLSIPAATVFTIICWANAFFVPPDRVNPVTGHFWEDLFGIEQI